MEQMIIDGLHAHNSLCDCVGQAQITMTAEFVPFANKPKGIIVLEDVYKAAGAAAAESTTWLVIEARRDSQSAPSSPVPPQQ